ncbi:MAG: hypothetical protein Q7R97_04745 [Candidatus Daviesbacteria bacterium]|nr:hypothetical protein [Candidatus Daviesbacteria bacterium]
MAIPEHDQTHWHPHQPNKLEGAVTVVQDLVELISLENPPIQLVGLPSYHLKAISEKINGWTPESLLYIAGCSKDQFISLCRKFDERLVAGECIELSLSDNHRQERIAQAIVQAIVRSNLNTKQALRETIEPWKTTILSKVNAYTQGIEQFTGLKAESLFP